MLSESRIHSEGNWLHPTTSQAAFQIVSLYSLYPCQASHTHILISLVSPLYPCLNLCTQYPPLFTYGLLSPPILHGNLFARPFFPCFLVAQVLYMKHTIIKNWFSYARPRGICSLETGFSHLEYFFFISIHFPTNFIIPFFFTFISSWDSRLPLASKYSEYNSNDHGCASMSVVRLKVSYPLAWYSWVVCWLFCVWRNPQTEFQSSYASLH